MAEQPGYTIAQAARIVRVTRRQLEYWASPPHALVSPSITREGSKRRLYSFFDLVELRTLARLCDEGRISLQKVRRVVGELEKVRDRPLRQCTLYSDGDTIYYLDENDPEGQTAIDVLRSWQVVLAIKLHGVEWEVRREIAALQLPAPPPELKAA